MFCGLGEEGYDLVLVFILLIPATFYIMGLVEGKKGFYLVLAGVFFHILGILFRGLDIGSVPLTEKRDNVSFMALSMALTYIYYYKKRNIRDIAMVALPLISMFTLIALVYRPLNTIPPLQRSIWFYFHMFLYFSSFGFFCVSSSAGLLYVIKGRGEHEIVQYQGNIYGWIVLSLSLVAGSVWFYLAYGTYWLWTSKEMWATLTWFFYGLYLHARYLKGLKGKPAGVIGIIGFAVALFTYFAIGPGKVIPSPPTQF